MIELNSMELAESFINGNISFVKEKLKGNHEMALKTADIILKFYKCEDYERFNKLMINK